MSIPLEYVELCHDWHGGQSSIMYSISSTGDLTRGSIRPKNDDGDPMTDNEWLSHLYKKLFSELYHLISRLDKNDDDDYKLLSEFEIWTQKRMFMKNIMNL